MDKQEVVFWFESYNNQLMKRLSALMPLLLFLLLLSGCQSNEIAESKTVDQNSIYQEYAVSYSERTGYATVRAAFRHGGSNGTTLLLSDSSSVTFNGHKMEADSNFLSGVFYYDPTPLTLKNGQAMRFVFTDLSGKKYANDYKMNVLKWQQLPKEVKLGEDLVIPVRANPGVFVGERIAVRLENQQHISSCLANLSDGKLTVYAKDLANLKGAVTVEITREYKEDVSASGSEGGACIISYEYEPFTVEVR